MTRTPQQAAAEAIFDAYEDRSTLTEAERAMKPAELAAARAIAAMEVAAQAEAQAEGFEWAIVEIMGHRRHAGRIREEERFGAKMIRVDVPVDGEPAKGWTTHFYGGAALFGVTPCTQEAALKLNRPYEPVSRLALPRPDRDVEDDGMPF